MNGLGGGNAGDTRNVVAALAIGVVLGGLVLAVLLANVIASTTPGSQTAGRPVPPEPPRASESPRGIAASATLPLTSPGQSGGTHAATGSASAPGSASPPGSAWTSEPASTPPGAGTSPAPSQTEAASPSAAGEEPSPSAPEPRPTSSGTAAPPAASETPPSADPAIRIGGGWQPAAWSPDGELLLVRREDESAVIDADGTILEVAGRELAWVPGGGRTLSTVIDDEADGDRLTLHDLATGDQDVLVEAVELQDAWWSRDGSIFALVDETGLSVGTRGGALDRITSSRPRRLALAPDGARVAYTDAQNGVLLVAETEGGEPREVPDLAPDGGDRPTFSPDGGWLVATARRGTGEGVFFVPADLSAEPLEITGEADPRSLSWAPAGATLGFAHLPAYGPTTELLVATFGSGEPEVRSLGVGRSISWNADGSALLSVDPGGRLLVYRIDGGEPEVRAQDADATCAARWSSDGRIAYCSPGDELRILPAE